MISDGKIQGIIKQDSFFFVKGSLKDDILNELRNSGKINLKDLSIKKQIGIDALSTILFEIIKEMGLTGSFDKNKEMYYLESYIIQYIESSVESKGRVAIDSLSDGLGIYSQYVKNLIIKMIKDQQINGFFADKGMEILSVKKLEAEVEAFCIAKEKFLERCC